MLLNRNECMMLLLSFHTGEDGGFPGQRTLWSIAEAHRALLLEAVRQCEVCS